MFRFLISYSKYQYNLSCLLVDNTIEMKQKIANLRKQCTLEMSQFKTDRNFVCWNTEIIFARCFVFFPLFCRQRIWFAAEAFFYTMQWFTAKYAKRSRWTCAIQTKTGFICDGLSVFGRIWLYQHRKKHWKENIDFNGQKQ